jgi:homoserine kinase
LESLHLNNMKKITILAPATVANLVCGFDILGLALNEPSDIMQLRFIDEPKLVILNADDFGLPAEPQKNVAGVALLSLMESLEKPVGFEMTIKKMIKPGSGIGSSAASAAGAVAAANILLDNIFSPDELIQFAMNGEKLASGVKHADNIAPCLRGGITLVRSIHPLDIIPITAPPLFVTIVHPQIEVRTADARQILKKQIFLKDAIRQWGNIAGLVAGLLRSDYALIGRSLEDVIIEPLRSILIPAFSEVKKKSLEAGALGGGISGSGPSIFMLSKEKNTAIAVEKEMSSIYNRLGIENSTYVTTINDSGIKIIPDEIL